MISKLGSYVRRHHVGLLALLVALSGTAYAANKVSSKDISKNAVLSRHIKNGQVKAGDLAGTVFRHRVLTITDTIANDGNYGQNGGLVACPKGARATGFQTQFMRSTQPREITGMTLSDGGFSAGGRQDGGGTELLEIGVYCLRKK